MSRPLRSKLLYVVALGTLGAAVVAFVVYSPFGKGLVLIATAIVLLIPGRIQGFVFRDHYRGKRLMGAGQLEAAIDHFERFLVQVREKSWKKRFIWFAWGIYSWDKRGQTGTGKAPG